MKTTLAIHLEWAAQDITNGDFILAMIHLRHAMSEANKLKRRDIKSLVFRAMNHIRSAQKIGAKSI